MRLAAAGGRGGGLTQKNSSHFGADGDAYKAIFESEDVEGNRGVRLDKGLPKLAGKLMRKALEPAAILNLPTLELLKVSVDRFRRQRDPAYAEANPTAYVPDFKTGIQHYCIHPGSKTIVNGVADSLGLSYVQRREGRGATGTDNTPTRTLRLQGRAARALAEDPRALRKHVVERDRL